MLTTKTRGSHYMVVNMSKLLWLIYFLASETVSGTEPFACYNLYFGTFIFFLHTNSNTTMTKIVGNVISRLYSRHSTFEKFYFKCI